MHVRQALRYACSFFILVGDAMDFYASTHHDILIRSGAFYRLPWLLFWHVSQAWIRLVFCLISICLALLGNKCSPVALMNTGLFHSLSFLFAKRHEKTIGYMERWNTELNAQRKPEASMPSKSEARSIGFNPPSFMENAHHGFCPTWRATSRPSTLNAGSSLSLTFSLKFSRKSLKQEAEKPK